eukprot:TRINITY_DN15560_c0_g1_i1.p4 TRINITY_DN15560_c0_g1~~TRINITY_DN15560_c0_g1_i1.p4  ORF type:complete len:136 (-),score=5.49 TRINITY_DN15560_c0_g1_i1:29-436(-)
MLGRPQRGCFDGILGVHPIMNCHSQKPVDIAFVKALPYMHIIGTQHEFAVLDSRKDVLHVGTCRPFPYLYYHPLVRLLPVPVSYTHLTLPTICSVQISVVAVSLKKKKEKKTSMHISHQPHQGKNTTTLTYTSRK